jgi:hypothetical protein
VSPGTGPADVGVRLSAGSPAHEFDDDEATRRLLRSRPPRRALEWAGSCLGGRVLSSTALRGGMSSAMHLLTVSLPTGEATRVGELTKNERLGLWPL